MLHPGGPGMEEVQQRPPAYWASPPSRGMRHGAHAPMGLPPPPQVVLPFSPLCMEVLKKKSTLNGAQVWLYNNPFLLFWRHPLVFPGGPDAHGYAQPGNAQAGNERRSACSGQTLWDLPFCKLSSLALNFASVWDIELFKNMMTGGGIGGDSDARVVRWAIFETRVWSAHWRRETQRSDGRFGTGCRTDSYATDAQRRYASGTPCQGTLVKGRSRSAVGCALLSAAHFPAAGQSCPSSAYPSCCKFRLKPFRIVIGVQILLLKAVAPSVTFTVDPQPNHALVQVKAVQGHGLSGDIIVKVSLTSPVVREEQLAAAASSCANGTNCFLLLSSEPSELFLFFFRKWRCWHERVERGPLEHQRLSARSGSASSCQVVSGNV